MAKISWLSIIVFLWLSVLVSETAMVKIHRAIPRNTKPTGTDDSSWFGFEPCKFLPDLSNIFVKKEAWLYSIPATILVGMCGIFPLLVIPVEAGHALREGGELFCVLWRNNFSVRARIWYDLLVKSCHGFSSIGNPEPHNTVTFYNKFAFLMVFLELETKKTSIYNKIAIIISHTCQLILEETDRSWQKHNGWKIFISCFLMNIALCP